MDKDPPAPRWPGRRAAAGLRIARTVLFLLVAAQAVGCAAFRKKTLADSPPPEYPQVGRDDQPEPQPQPRPDDRARSEERRVGKEC